MRTWSALAISSLFGWLLPPLSIAAYIVVDTMAAALVLRRPAGLAQKAVGLGFAGMIMFHCGYLVSAQQNWEGYYAAQSFVGWLQLACLAAWGMVDVGLVLVRHRARRRQMDIVARV